MAYRMTVSLSSILIMALFFPSTSAQSSFSVFGWFTYVNQGELGEYITEYGADYRVLPIANAPFQLCFYNTTPNAFTLAIRMGTRLSESLFRWVWEANRSNPVRENATLTFRPDGNLVLADADGRVAWQTATANSGVAGLQLLPTGNLVLHDSRGNFVWQSFDHPTDTLLVGQSLRTGPFNKLVSRVSDKDNSPGPYSLELQSNLLGLYYKAHNDPRPYLYFSSEEWFTVSQRPQSKLTFISSPDDAEGHAYNLILESYAANSSSGSRILTRPKYNATLSFLRVGSDGNIRIYTYDDKVDWGAWEETYTLFSRDSKDECRMPERCGQFGLCEDSQCVACPTPGGLAGWRSECRSERLLPSCRRVGDVGYYKLQGVDHFGSRYSRGQGPLKEIDCQRKCTRECKCLGYFYHSDKSTCWTVYDLKTLTRVHNSTHAGYIKMAQTP